MEFLGCQTLSQISSSNLKVSNAERVGAINPGMVIYLCHLGWEKTATGAYQFISYYCGHHANN